jgi:hypothetical protein
MQNDAGLGRLPLACRHFVRSPAHALAQSRFVARRNGPSFVPVKKNTMKAIVKYLLWSVLIALSVRSIGICREHYTALQQRYTTEARGKALGFITGEIME